MNRDALMLGAFALFLILVVILWRKTCNEKQKQTTLFVGRRRIFKIIQLLILFGLLIYMIPLLWMDLQDVAQIVWSEFLLRCLIFVITIYILFLGIRRLLGKVE